MSGHHDRERTERGRKAPKVPPSDVAEVIARAKARAKEQPITIRVVPNEYGACPRCGAYWGHPDKSLDWPNRSKVGDEDGVWWWKCYNPNCTCGYYDPDTGRSDDRPSPEQEAESRREAEEYVANLMKGKKWVSRTLANGIVQSELVDDPDSPDYDPDKEQR